MTPPTLVMPLFSPNFDVIHGGWLGGVVYVRMLVKLLSDLDADERPRILVLTDAKADHPTIVDLAAAPAVAAILSPDGAAISLSPEFETAVTRGGALDQAAVESILAGAETLFPISRAMFNPDTALHWIPDFQHRHLPEMFDADELTQREREVRIMLYSRRFVLVSSQDAAADLRRYYPDAPAKIYVWSFISALDVDARPPNDPRPKYRLPEKYLFAPNQFWKHKDHLTLFKAIAVLKERGHNVTLVCTGAVGDSRHPNHYRDLQTFVRERDLGRHIVHLGLVPAGDLLDLFRFSAAVAQPSLFEGWSTVVEDAKAVGRPIFLTDLGVHREQSSAPNPFYFFPPGDVDGLAREIAARWETLAPGPDPEAETAAVLARQARARTSARAFLGIMRDMARSKLG